MKKIILFASLLFVSLTNAQQATVRVNGTLIQDGYTFTTSSLAGLSDVSQPNKLRFSVTNTGTEGIYVGAKLISKSTNAPAEGTQLCFGSLCLPNVTASTLVPYYDELPAGETTPSEDDHFINTIAGSDSNPVSYQIGIVKLSIVVNEDGDQDVTELETLVTFNYVYQPTAGLNDLSALDRLGLSVQNTVVKNALNVTAAQNADLQIFDINGKAVKVAALKSGAQAVDLSALATGVYTARFTTGTNKVATLKIVKN
jgi:hypothetical protein